MDDSPRAHDDDVSLSALRTARDTRRQSELIAANSAETRETAKATRDGLTANRTPIDAATVFEFTCGRCGPFMEVAYGKSARRKVFRCPECGGHVTEDSLYDETGQRLPTRPQAHD